VDSAGSGYGATASSCEVSNEPAGFITDRIFLHFAVDYYLLKKGPTPYSLHNDALGS
jgi:hypothetical protein